MKIEKIASLGQYRKFYRTVYGNDRNFKDNKSALLPLVCGTDSAFYKNSIQEMAAVTDRGATLCQAVFIVHRNSPDVLNIAFFEALPDCNHAVELLFSYGAGLAEKYGCRKLLAGMDGHLNYALGFSADAASAPAFGESYNPAYYHDYFRDFTPISLCSFTGELSYTKGRIDEDYERFRETLKDYRVEAAKINPESMKRYTDLSNAIFADHPCYFKREYEEDLELFRPMSILLRKSNLLFIKEGALDIGYILWYPDYNEFVRPGKSFGLPEFASCILKGGPKSVKVVEIGLLKGYQNSGIIMLAFQVALDAAYRHFPAAEKLYSSWIESGNTRSVNLTKRYTQRGYKTFYVYEKSLFGTTAPVAE